MGAADSRKLSWACEFEDSISSHSRCTITRAHIYAQAHKDFVRTGTQAQGTSTISRSTSACNPAAFTSHEISTTIAALKSTTPLCFQPSVQHHHGCTCTGAHMRTSSQDAYKRTRTSSAQSSHDDFVIGKYMQSRRIYLDEKNITSSSSVGSHRCTRTGSYMLPTRYGTRAQGLHTQIQGTRHKAPCTYAQR